MFSKLKKGLSLAIIMTLCLNVISYGADIEDNSVFLGENLIKNNGQIDVGNDESVGDVELGDNDNALNEDNGIMTPDLPDGEDNLPIPDLPENEDGENIPELPNFDDPVITIPPVDENIDGGMMVEPMDLGVLISTPKDVTELLKSSTTTFLFQEGKDIYQGGNLDASKPVHVKLSLSKIPVLGDNTGQGENTYVKSGDTLTVRFPKEMKFKYAANVDVKSGDGTVIGTIVFNNVTKTATITFNEVLNELSISNVSAEIDIEMDFDDTNISQGDEKKPINILGKDYTYSVPDKPIEITLEETGIVNRESQSITWTVTAKATYKDDKKDASLKGYTFSDDLANIGGYKTDTFKINDSEVIPTYNNSILSYNFKETDIGENIITFETAIKDEDFYSKTSIPGKITKKNTAKILKGNSEIIKKEASVEFEQPTWIIKGYEASAKTKDITWKIEANSLSFEFDEVVITDNITDTNLRFKSAKLYKKESGSWISAGKEWTTQPQDGKYDIGKVSYPIKLEIVTNANGAEVETEYRNKASISWEDPDGTGGREYSSKDIKY